MTKKDVLKAEALVRQATRNLRTNQEQIAVLDERLKPGVGAVKERFRLGGNPTQPVYKPKPKVTDEPKKKFKKGSTQKKSK